MKILLFFTFNTSLLDWETAGFIKREAIYINKLIKEKNCKITLLTYGDERDILIADKYFNCEVIPVYKFKKRFKNKYINFIYSIFFPIFIRSYANKHDVLKTNQLNGSWVPLLTSLITGKPLITRTGYDIYSFKKNENKNFFVTKFYFILTKLNLKYSKIYFSTSKVDMHKLANDFPSYKQKLVYLPNWINDLKVNPNHSNNFAIVSVGRLEKQKNYHGLFNSLKGSKFEINLIGEGSLKNNLVNLAKKNDLNVKFLGIFQHSELMKYLSKMKIYISSSIFEGNPKSILEAMNSGCVVIANDNENIREIIENGKTGILFNIASDNLIEILNNLVDNNNLLNEISQNAFNYVQQNNSLSRVVEKEFIAYDEMIFEKK